MNTEYKPSYEGIVVVVAILAFTAITVFSQYWLFTGILSLGLAFVMALEFLFGYRKYIVTDKNLRVVNWRGEIKSEIEYNEITRVFLHKSYARTRRGYAELHTLVIDLTSGETARLDLTPIDESLELVQLVKERAGF